MHTPGEWRACNAQAAKPAQARECIKYYYDVFWGSYDIERLKAGGHAGSYGRTPVETEALILHAIDRLDECKARIEN